MEIDPYSSFEPPLQIPLRSDPVVQIPEVTALLDEYKRPDSHHDAELQRRETSDLNLHGLSHLIPLGCFQFELGENALRHETGTWHVISYSNQNQILEQCPPQVEPLWSAGWIRLMYRTQFSGLTTVRIYVLPEDVGQVHVDRQVRSLRKSLGELVQLVDISPVSWEGTFSKATQTRHFDLWATGDDTSLFYLFNTLPSPSPNSATWKTNPFTLRTMKELVGGVGHASTVTGLNTILYPYQARSAALMIQREINPTLSLDPRLEPRTAPDGSTFYYSPRDVAFFRNPRQYESIRGGILAETMGLGKTIICLALVLATRHTLPQVPVQYEVAKPERRGVLRLLDLVISSAGRNSVPLKACLDRRRHAEGVEYSQITQAIENHPIEYLIPHVPIRTNRRTEPQPPRRMMLCSGTIIVVPRNLV